MIDQYQKQDNILRDNKQIDQNHNKRGQTRRNKRMRHSGEDQMLMMLQNCEGIIKQQQEHIRRLEKDNLRKQTIIANLLQRKQQVSVNRQLINPNKQRIIQNVQALSEKINQIQNKYEQVLIQKQKIEKQTRIKDKRAKQLSDIIETHQKRESQLYSQLQECRRMANQLKQAYQAKISVLLTEIRKRVEQDIIKCKQKQMFKVNQLSHHIPEGLKNQVGSLSNHVQLQTPIKYKIDKLLDNQSDNFSREKTIEKNYLIFDLNKERKRLINTPYRESRNVMGFSHGTFPFGSERTEKKQRGLNKKNLLEDIDDVQFLSDANQRSDLSSQSANEKNSKIQEDEKDGQKKVREWERKIPIQDLIKQFGEYWKKQEQSLEQVGQQRQQQVNEKNVNKMKIAQILEKLSLKIKKFENQNIEI